MLFLEVWGTQNGLFGVNVGYNIVHLLVTIAESTQRSRHCLVDDTHCAAADKLLHLHEAKIRLYTSRIAVHHEPNGACWRQHARLAVSHAVELTEFYCFIPRCCSGVQEIFGHKACVDVIHCLTVHTKHLEHVIAVFMEAREWTNLARHLCACRIAVTRQDSSDGSSLCSTLCAIIRQALGHQECAEVGIADS